MGRAPKPGEFIHCVGHFSDANYGRSAMGMRGRAATTFARRCRPPTPSTSRTFREVRDGDVVLHYRARPINAITAWSRPRRAARVTLPADAMQL